MAAERGARPGRAKGRRARRLRLVGVISALLLAGIASLAPDRLSPTPGEPTRPVTVIDHGFHTGLVLRSADLRAAAIALGRERPVLAARLRQIGALWPWAGALEIGWGDAAVYPVTPRLSDLDPVDAIAALAWPTPSVMQLVPLAEADPASWPGRRALTLALPEAGYAALAARLAETIETGPRGRPVLGPQALYGLGRFIEAAPSYHAFRTCNHWVSAVLRAGGVPSSWLFSATSAGLMAELRLRL